MHPLTTVSAIATVILCWIPGGLIHLGARSVDANAAPPISNLRHTALGL